MQKCSAENPTQESNPRLKLNRAKAILKSLI
jgi:hypothetical protein